MKGVRRLASLEALLCVGATSALLCIAASPTAAPDATPPPPTAPPPTAPPPTVPPAPPAPTGPAASRLLLTVQRVGGRPLFALVGARIVVRGVVWPYVGGQSVKVSIYREGR